MTKPHANNFTGLLGMPWRTRPLAASVDDLVQHFRTIGLSAADVVSRRYHRIVQYQAQQPAHLATAR